MPSSTICLVAWHISLRHTHGGLALKTVFSSSSSSLSSLFFFRALCLFRQKYFSRSLSRCWGFEPVFLWVRQGADKNRKYRLADWRILFFLFLCCEGKKKKGGKGGRKLRTKQPKPSIICLFFCIKGTIQFGPEATTITTKKYYVFKKNWVDEERKRNDKYMAPVGAKGGSKSEHAMVDSCRTTEAIRVPVVLIVIISFNAEFC